MDNLFNQDCGNHLYTALDAQQPSLYTPGMKRFLRHIKYAIDAAEKENVTFEEFVEGLELMRDEMSIRAQQAREELEERS